MKTNLPEKVIFDFSEQTDVSGWTIVNDQVMGGLSESSMQRENNGIAVFSGCVSLENNGGFASASANIPEPDLKAYSGISLKVFGDGKTYKFRIRTEARFDTVTYSSDFFAPKGEWTEVNLMFSDFKPSFRGRELPNVGPLDSAGIRQIGLLISDKQAGDFILKVDWIKAI